MHTTGRGCLHVKKQKQTPTLCAGSTRTHKHTHRGVVHLQIPRTAAARHAGWLALVIPPLVHGFNMSVLWDFNWAGLELLSGLSSLFLSFCFFVFLSNFALSNEESYRLTSLESLIKVPWTHTHTHIQSNTHTYNQIFEDVRVGALLAWFSRQEELCYMIRPAGLVQIALTFPVHEGAMFSLALSICQGQVELHGRQWLLHRKRVYFLTLCNKGVLGGDGGGWEHHVEPCLCVLFMFIYSVFVSMLAFSTTMLFRNIYFPSRSV